MEQRILDLLLDLVFTDLKIDEFNTKLSLLKLEFGIEQNVLGYRKRIVKVGKRRITHAYYDVARYQTDVLDAAIEWGVAKDILDFVLEHRRVPKTPEDRLILDVPKAVRKKREVGIPRSYGDLG